MESLISFVVIDILTNKKNCFAPRGIQNDLRELANLHLKLSFKKNVKKRIYKKKKVTFLLGLILYFILKTVDKYIQIKNKTFRLSLTINSKDFYFGLYLRFLVAKLLYNSKCPSA